MMIADFFAFVVDLLGAATLARGRDREPVPRVKWTIAAVLLGGLAAILALSAWVVWAHSAPQYAGEARVISWIMGIVGLISALFALRCVLLASRA